MTLFPFFSSSLPSVRSVASAEQSERVSLDSRGSAEVSVTSAEAAPGEVAVGNLVDISAAITNGKELIHVKCVGYV